MWNNVIGDRLVNVIVDPHDDCLLDGFVELQRTEAILIKTKKLSKE